MLVVRATQMLALANAAAEAFAADSVKRIAARFPEVHRRIGDAETLAWIRQALARCKRYEIDEIEHVDVYIGVLFTLEDPDFDQNHAWAKKILENRQFASSMKAMELEDGLAAELERRAAPNEDDE